MSQSVLSDDSTTSGGNSASPGQAPVTEETPVRRGNVEPMTAAKTPVGPGSISAVGLFLALVVVGIGVLGVQAALVATGLLGGRPWLTSVLERPDGLMPAGWMLAAGVVLAVVGLWLVLTALRPRPRTGVAVQATTGVFLRPRDLSRLAVAAAKDVDGVQDAHASATRRKVTVRITSTAGETAGDQVGETVTAAVTERLSALEKPVRVIVRTVGGTR